MFSLDSTSTFYKFLSCETLSLNWKADLVLPVSGSQDETIEAVEQHGKVLVLILGDLQLQFLHIAQCQFSTLARKDKVR
jgi:hypothetical protein